MHPKTWLTIQKQLEQYAEHRIEIEERISEAKRHFIHILKERATEHWETWRNLARQQHLHLIPDFDEAPNKVYAVESAPSAGIIAATDGSQIFPSGHEIAPIALIHISRIRFDYLHYQDEQLMDNLAELILPENMLNEDDVSRQDWVSDRRTLMEISTLAEIVEEARQVHSDIPILALSDGSLILWSLAGRNDTAYERSISREFIAALERFQNIGVPIAGYISRSGSREIVQLLQRVESQAALEHDAPKEKEDLPITDTQIFGSLLKEGQRSILFHSRSRIMESYGDQRISSFYMNVGSEIAKIEVPHWLAKNQTLVNAVAANCWKQARIGGGYPIVLAEAHEQAVIRGADREIFFSLLEQQLMQRGICMRPSQKQLRKRVSMI